MLPSMSNTRNKVARMTKPGALDDSYTRGCNNATSTLESSGENHDEINDTSERVKTLLNLTVCAFAL